MSQGQNSNGSENGQEKKIIYVYAWSDEGIIAVKDVLRGKSYAKVADIFEAKDYQNEIPEFKKPTEAPLFIIEVMVPKRAYFALSEATSMVKNMPIHIPKSVDKAKKEAKLMKPYTTPANAYSPKEVEVVK